MKTQILENTVSNVLMKESYVEVSYVPSLNLVIAKWIGFLTIEDVTKGCTFVTALIRKHNIKVHLSDHRQLKVLSKDVQGYLTMQWFSEVERVGLRKIGVVVAEDIFAVATVSKVNKEAKVGNLTIDMFQSDEACLAWLQE